MEKKRVHRQNYVYGSAAPAVVEPFRKPAQERPAHRDTGRANRDYVSHTVTARRNREKAKQMNLPYVIVLTLAAVCMLYLCISYLQLQSSISARMSNIERLERQLETVKADNDALETKINTSVDLDHVYKVATEELGMVYASKDQVRLYDKTESEYVRQYEDIPER